MSDKGKAERLAAQLRENLRRRKAQAREMSGGEQGEPARPERSDKGG